MNTFLIYSTLTAPPVAHLHCNHDTVTVCYTSSHYKLNPIYLSTNPKCVHATVARIEDGVCTDIPMNKCETTKKQVSNGQ